MRNLATKSILSLALSSMILLCASELKAQGLVDQVIFMAKFKYKGGGGLISVNRIWPEAMDTMPKIKELLNPYEIWILLPLKKNLDTYLNDGRVVVRIEVDKELFSTEILPYKTERGQNYLTFALAKDPATHIPEQSFRKEGTYSRWTSFLAESGPGKHKLRFGITPGTSLPYDVSANFTYTATEADCKRWAEWAAKIEAMEEDYKKRLK